MEHLIIQQSNTIIDGFKKMDAEHTKMLLLYNNNKFINLVTIGDLQRALLKGQGTEELLENIIIGDKQLAYTNESEDEIQEKLNRIRSEYIPVLNDKHEIVKIVYWKSKAQKEKKKTDLNNIPVVIMAGGQGTRLRPITNVIPKALVPIGEKPIIESIMDRFNACGSKQFLLSVNYKWEVIRDYFNNFKHSFEIEYFQEEKPLGTAGSLSLMRDKLTSTFFISNCDIVIEDEYEHILKYHKENKNIITIVACLKNYSIPYGIMTRTEDGLLDEMKEKPNDTYLINTGMYILEPEVLDMVPNDTFFHITELIDKVKKSEKRVGIFPVSEGSWKDIGEWPEYLKNYVNI